MQVNIRSRVSEAYDAVDYVHTKPTGTDGHGAIGGGHAHHWWSPLTDLNGSLDHLNNTLDGLGQFFHALGYWLNPVNVWRELGHLFAGGSLDTPLVVLTIIGIMMLMAGAKWPKKWIFWGWVLFWILRGVMFA